MSRKHQSIFSAIKNRETYGSCSHNDVFMLRRLVERDGQFKKVWEKSSKSAIVYDGHVYFDTYRTCYELSGLPSEPRLVYQLPKLASSHKIESFLVFESPLDQTAFSWLTESSCPTSLYSLGLTKDNYLKVLHTKRGDILQTIYLSACHNFKYLFWETDLERVLVKSTLSPPRPGPTGMPRLPSTAQSAQVVYLTILTICPLQFLCTLPVGSHVFGPNVCNASIRNGLLIVMYLKGKMTFHNFNDILKNNVIPLKLGQDIRQGNVLGLPEMDKFTSGIVGQAHIGLPVNVHLTEKPPVLFEVASNNHDISFGGFPWHYIMRRNQVYEVKSLGGGNRLVKNSYLESKALSIETDKAFFHADLSNRILHIESSILRCFKLNLLNPICQDNIKEYCLLEQFGLDFTKTPTTTPIRTQSGRHVKQLYNSYHGNIQSEIILDVDFDDELDVLVVLYHDQANDNGGIVGFYDNQTGQNLHQFKVDGIAEEAEHSVAINRNALVIISKNKASFSCTIYALGIVC